MFDNKFMLQALALAKQAFLLDEIPVGAVIVDQNNMVIARQHNQVETTNNPLAHAEILAINQACQKLNSKYLQGCKIYTTLEPCHHCLSGLLLAKIDFIYYGADDLKMGAISSSGHHHLMTSYYKPQIYGGICIIETQELLQSFFKKLR